jgi:hypothetical protein
MAIGTDPPQAESGWDKQASNQMDQQIGAREPLA